jgi:hypothetical protein
VAAPGRPQGATALGPGAAGKQWSTRQGCRCEARNYRTGALRVRTALGPDPERCSVSSDGRKGTRPLIRSLHAGKGPPGRWERDPGRSEVLEVGELRRLRKALPSLAAESGIPYSQAQDTAHTTPSPGWGVSRGPLCVRGGGSAAGVCWHTRGAQPATARI